ncbi:hypothetical protein [Spirulina sp. 06S082]|uniref:hypothetical protein n=1 Tax=Spirulina sp. 06S082 TaxID=3110248 RepID=UPI002B220B2C|nr:hypothetical protein [Spirulina sp. 06S082]MEA5470215.1 hypothetical protein [Spirulina sp. 06S082]
MSFLLEAMIQGGETVSYTYDNSRVSQTIENGNVTDVYSYDAYGNLIDSVGNSENDYLFAGEQFDSNLDQYYLRDRFY